MEEVTVADTMEIKLLAVENILVDPRLNARKSFDEKRIKSLAGDIKANGMLNPVTCRLADEDERKNTGCEFVLIAGYRRMAALAVNKTEVVTANVLVADAETAAIINLNENLARENLSTFEIATACAEIQKSHKLVAKDIAKKLCGVNEEGKALSEASINNYIRLINNLNPDIIECWASKHPKSGVTNLLKIVSHEDHDEQWGLWEELCGVTLEDTNDDNEEEEGEEKETKEKKRRRPGEDAIKLAIAEVKKSNHSEDYIQGAVIGLQWAAGLRATIPGLPKQEKKSGKKKKAG